MSSEYYVEVRVDGNRYSYVVGDRRVEGALDDILGMEVKVRYDSGGTFKGILTRESGRPAGLQPGVRGAKYFNPLDRCRIRVSDLECRRSVAAVILRDLDGKVLALERSADNWGLIGGKVDPGESVEGALWREIGEECGLGPQELLGADPDRVGDIAYLDTITPPPLLDEDDGYRRQCAGYLFQVHDAHPHSGPEGRVEWVDWHVLTMETCTYRDYNVRALRALLRRVR